MACFIAQVEENQGTLTNRTSKLLAIRVWPSEVNQPPADVTTDYIFMSESSQVNITWTKYNPLRPTLLPLSPRALPELLTQTIISRKMILVLGH